MANKFNRCALCCILTCGAARAAQAQGPDPFAGNNTVYPKVKEWENKSFRTSNYNYPLRPVVSKWLSIRPTEALTKATAPAYVAAVKKFIERDMSQLVNDPLHWSPQQVGWYDMPWGGQGSMMTNGQVDPSTGREALLGSYTGQILQSNSYPMSQRPSAKSFQNHAVVYYNDVAAHHLGNIWKNPYKPDLSDTQYPEGSIAMKVEGVTLADSQWLSRVGPPVLKGSSVSYLYRPSVGSMDSQPDPTKRVPVVTPITFLQMAVRIKDRVASP